MEWWLVYLLLDALVVFFAGLLGIGGGLIVVPALTLIFTAQDFPPERILHLALGTTMATIIFTSAASLLAHHAHGAVNWAIVKKYYPRNYSRDVKWCDIGWHIHKPVFEHHSCQFLFFLSPLECC